MFLVFITVIGLFSFPAYAQDPTPDQIDQGRQVYDDLCMTCHGRDMVSPGLVTFDLRKFPKMTRYASATQCSMARAPRCRPGRAR